MIKKYLTRFIKESVPFDPKTLGDPVALTTEWVPLKKGGANFCTHKLSVKNARIEFRPSLGAYVFCFFFCVMGLMFVANFVHLAVVSHKIGMLISAVFPVAIGSVFVVVGVVLLRSISVPITFDTALGYFWKGRVTPEELFLNSADTTREDLTAINRIYALQIIAEYCRGSKSSYYSYEINLVLKDGKRVNVIDHGNLNRIRADAQTLSNMLGKPVWDATATGSDARRVL